MKNIYSIVVTILLFPSFISAQQASDYFPDQAGFTWLYKVTPLDSLNDPIFSQTFFRADSFTSITNYEDSLANVVISKEGPAEQINLIPFTDSSYYHFSGSQGSEYLDLGRLDLFLAALDSIVADSNFSFLNIFQSFEEWYSTYRFNSDINHKYTLFTVDTSLVINSTDIPLRFEYNAIRLEDDTIETDLGSFDCKKFIRERGISYLIFPPPPVPPIPIPIAFFNDTTWIAENYWIVQSILPTTIVDLGLIIGDTLTVPGLKIAITDEITGIKESNNLLQKFNLSQNFPNPFNPVTNIKFSVKEIQKVELKVFDVLGREIQTLVNKILPAGEYQSVFDANKLPSGIYLYVLKAGNSSISKKMILLK